MQDRLQLGLGASNIAHIADSHVQRSPEEATQVSCRVRQLICFMVPPLDRDEDAQVVLSGRHSDRRASELGCDLVETLGMDALLRAVDVKCTDGRVMGGLLGEVRDAHRFRGVGGGLGYRHARRGTGIGRQTRGRQAAGGFGVG